jgi:hypothetical protein
LAESDAWLIFSHPSRVTILVFEKKSPKMYANPFYVQINDVTDAAEKKSNPNFWATVVIFKTLSEGNNRPIGENSPNLVTLHPSIYFQFPTHTSSTYLETHISIAM